MRFLCSGNRTVMITTCPGARPAAEPAGLTGRMDFARSLPFLELSFLVSKTKLRKLVAQEPFQVKIANQPRKYFSASPL